MKKYLVFLLPLIFTGCTYNVSVIHSEGQASDLIDATQEAKPDISPTVSIPSPLAKL